MITQEQIPLVINHTLYAADGDKVGEVKHVFLDDATGRPEWLCVKTGLFGINETFVPIRDANLVQDHIEVPYDKETIKDAPHVDVDARGHLSAEEEQELYRYYDIDWESSWQEANRPGETGWAHTGGLRERERLGRSEEDLGRSTDDAMTRSEERMHVGTESHPTGRARLRKYIVTEEQQITVPVTRERARVEREPITDANVDEALRGPELTEDEHEITLHEERPVITTETVPVERVRLTKEQVTEQETVSGKVRKEQIDAEGDTDETGRLKGRRRGDLGNNL
ncbi:DUF2382 domain-containing protein [Planomonospora venezuelensis]|uniref:Uncharacterized protein (TIGR02271 family) n=1 Tax=Planomonospora venezuelensis TaxID=1999 RepID=A0A841CUP9_PLAVE|nr:PRC and DUF2382 domain-containing protein [Planomonospora venezuelensis]MBB5961571.1 uncharacterized protein (TIGR02271 family) [Planomonospora venezuelensis]GIM98717.1 photosystem reaction center subunit H [Planomonospora venezuelensis]